ncbi:MAG: BPSS1780 family membrane protein [Methylophilaceae bacterium]|nr:BPSS1780 family membrane protein [Methylophilaceae bacterium]
MQARNVAAGNGWRWIKEGYALFRLNPAIWIALFFIYLLICMALSFVPLIGPILLNLLAPVFVAGFMLGCKALEAGEELEINHLFAGFKQNAAELITVGGLYLAGMIVVAGVVFLLTGGSLLASGDARDLKTAADEGALLTALVGLSLLLPLIMAYWFAPLLVVFHRIKPLDAMKTSFFACLHNIPPFTVYSVISMVLLVLAALPLGLGLLVMIPTMTASLYTSYKDIFAETPN